MKTLHLRNSIGRSPWRCSFLLIPLVLACFALCPTARAVLPAPTPDGGYAGENTAEGQHALFSLTTGGYNTAVGYYALDHNTSGSDNTATGRTALLSNTYGHDNTANGYNALAYNTSGIANTATGSGALFGNTNGSNNTANGSNALQRNTTGFANTATGSAALFNNIYGSTNTANGDSALLNNTSGGDNTATGWFALRNNNANLNTADGAQALEYNTTGYGNTATGVLALYLNTIGHLNTADGGQALVNNTSGVQNTACGNSALLHNTSGSNNIALGFGAGINLTTGSNNIDIGSTGVAGESNIIRIGGSQTAIYFGTGEVHLPQIGSYDASAGVPVYLDANGRLGVGDVCPAQCQPSSERFKDNIKPMDKASEAILALKPVTFRYKKEFNPKGIPQFGLVAEEVQKVNPDLVVRDPQGKPYGVRYDAVNAMLLNEFLKQHRAFLKEQHKVKEQEATIAHLKRQMETVVARLEQQDSKIEKVSAQFEASKSVPQVVNNN